MKTFLAAVALAATMFTAAAADAQSVNRRQYNQQARIHHGYHSGRLTAGEAVHLQRQQTSINRHEQALRARNGGYLTRRDRAVLNHRQNHASRNIVRAKTNGWGR